MGGYYRRGAGALPVPVSPLFFFLFLRGAGVLIPWGGSLQDGSGVSLEDHNDGTYTLSVMATLAGQHPLTVRHLLDLTPNKPTNQQTSNQLRDA